MAALAQRANPLADNRRVFERLRALILEVSGISLSERHVSMLAARLQPLVDSGEFADLEAYCDAVTKPGAGALLSELIDRVSTNHTFFNRESDHYEHFVNVSLAETLALRARTGGKRLRVWCAASSTGQEPYTLAMLMMQKLGSSYASWDAGVLATDISTRALEKAIAGVYTEDEIAKLPKALRARFFQAQSGGTWRASDELRAEVLFRRLNLTNPRFPFRKPFDVVFCRNVMIYFENDVRLALVTKIYNHLRPGGYLYIGAAESLPRGHRYMPVGKSVFKKLA